MSRRYLIVHGCVVAGVLAAVAALWAFGMVDFFRPWWLAGVLLVPALDYLAVRRSLSGLPPRTNAVSMTLRAVLLLLLVLALADIQIIRKHSDLAVIFLLDHSASIPESVLEQENTYLREALKTAGKKDRAGIVVFGEDASVEVLPTPELKMESLRSAVDRNYTNIENALRLSTAAFPPDARKKIVLITDGNENVGHIIDGVHFASGNGVVVDVLPVSYRFDAEVLMDSLQVRNQVEENESFDLRVHVTARQDCDATLYLYQDDRALTPEGYPVKLKEGQNSFRIPMRLKSPGFHHFRARVAANADTIPYNNQADSYVYIQGRSRNLFVAPTQLEVQHLMGASEDQQIEAVYMPPEEFPQSLPRFENFDCIVLANVGAENFTRDQLAMIQVAVRDLGIGLIMIGGVNSFGAGDYYATPVEEALPVYMDLRQKKIVPKGALALVLHTCEFANGNHWAKEITKAAIRTLNPQDEVGVLYFGFPGGDSWLFNLAPAGDKQQLYAQVDNCNPGDMPSFAPCFSMALSSLNASDAMVKHIVVISDGDPARPMPQDVQALADAGITCSTVGINPHSERDVDVLRYIAQKTGGRFYYPQDPSTLPQIFIKEAKTVQRALIFDEPFYPRLVQSGELLKGVTAEEIPPLAGYVATSPKERATVYLVSDNENEDPILASWRYGLGKSVAFTSDATSNWGVRWVAWAQYEKVWGQIIRWASRDRQKSDLQVRTQIDGTTGRVVVDAIGQTGDYLNFLDLAGTTTTPDLERENLGIRQTAPGRYEAEFQTRGVGVNLIHLQYQDPRTGKPAFMAAGLVVPYSAEYREFATDTKLLDKAATASGGRVLAGDPEKDDVFKCALPPTRSFRPLWEALLIAALALFLLDVVLRRVIITREDLLGVWHALRRWVMPRRAAADGGETMAALLERKRQVAEQQREAAERSAAIPSDFQDALRREARQRPGGRPPAAAVEQVRDAPKPTAGAATPPPDEMPPAAAPPKPETYTSRLLEAKRRARRNRNQDDDAE